MSIKYTYLYSTDFTQQSGLNEFQLGEIINSEIPNYVYITVINKETVNIYFSVTLSESEESQLTSIINAFIPVSGIPGSVNYIILRDTKSIGTNGGNFISDIWVPRYLNVLETDIPDFITLNTGTNSGYGVFGANGTENPTTFTIKPGTYSINITAPAFNVLNHQIRLWNNTNSTTDAYGSSEYCYQSVTISRINYNFIISNTTTFTIEHKCNKTQYNDGFGRSAGNTVNEIYTQVIISKLK